MKKIPHLLMGMLLVGGLSGCNDQTIMSEDEDQQPSYTDSIDQMIFSNILGQKIEEAEKQNFESSSEDNIFTSDSGVGVVDNNTRASAGGHSHGGIVFIPFIGGSYSPYGGGYTGFGPETSSRAFSSRTAPTSRAFGSTSFRTSTVTSSISSFGGTSAHSSSVGTTASGGARGASFSAGSAAS